MNRKKHSAAQTVNLSFGIILLCFILSKAQGKTESQWCFIADSVVNEVKIKTDGTSWLSVKKGDTLRIGDEIAVWIDSKLFLTDKMGHRVTAGELSHFRLERENRKDNGISHFFLKLQKGLIFLNILPGRKEKPFGITTQQGRIKVKGTAFFVYQKEEKQAVEVAVIRGVVAFTSFDEKTDHPIEEGGLLEEDDADFGFILRQIKPEDLSRYRHFLKMNHAQFEAMIQSNNNEFNNFKDDSKKRFEKFFDK